MSKVDEEREAETLSEEDARHLLDLLETERIFNLAVKEAQEENRRLGIPNYYEINGRLVSDQEEEDRFQF
jgi:hypothetical protein